MNKDIPAWLAHEPVMQFEGFLDHWHLDEVDLADLEKIADRYSRTLCNYVHLPFMLIGDACGIVPNKIYFKTSKLPNQAEKNLLEPMLAALHQRNIRVVLYFNGHCVEPAYARDHLEASLQVTEDGKPKMDVYGTGGGPCPNGPWRQWQKQVIEEAATLPIDGVFLDGDIFFANTCYCRCCRDLFRKRYGKELPPKSDRKHPDWRLLREFQIDSMTAYVAELRQALKARRPDGILFCNAGIRGANWPTGRQNRRLIEVQDALLSEGGFIYNDLNLTPLWKTECEVKLCKNQSMGKPVLSGLAIDHKPWNMYGHTPLESRLMLYSGLAAGACPMIAASSGDRISATFDLQEKELFQPVYGFVRHHKYLLYPTDNRADIAIAWSNVNADYYSGSSVGLTDFTKEVSGGEIGNTDKEFSGFYDGFWRNHLPTDVVDEVSLRDPDILKKYRLLVLPNVACLSQEEASAISAYVHEGGTLMASFEASLYDEYGEKRDNFALSDVLGVDFGGEVWGPMRHDLLECVSDTVMKAFDINWPYTPAPTYGIKVRPRGGRSLVGYHYRKASSYDGMAGLSSDGLLFENTFGKGRAYYFAGSFGQSLMEFHFPEYLDLLGMLGRRASVLNIDLKNAPECVAVALRQNTRDHRYILFLINHAGAMNRPRRSVLPLRDIQVECGLFCNKVESLVDGRIYKVENVAPQRKGFTLPLLREWDVFTWKSCNSGSQ